MFTGLSFTMQNLFAGCQLDWYKRNLVSYIGRKSTGHELGDNCIQNFHLGRYIVGFTVGNLVLRGPASGAVKRDFRTYIRRYTSPNENFEYGYPHSNALLQFELKLERCKPHKAACHPTKVDLINDVKLFPTVYHKFWRYPFSRCVTNICALE